MNRKRSTFFQEIATKAQKLYLLSVFSSTSFLTQHLIIKMIHEGHFIPSGSPMDGKVLDRNDILVCYVYKCKK